MAIKAGQILHAMNRFVVDRIQTAGAGNLNIPTERIHELGNYQSVAIVRDVPDLSFNLDCLDVSTEVESLLLGSSDPSADVFGSITADYTYPTGNSDAEEFVLANSLPVDITSPMKSKQGNFDIVKGVAIPQLTLESASYRYGLRDNAGETFTLRGDSIYYSPGSVHVQHETGDGTTTAFAFTVTDIDGDATPNSEAVNALLYKEQGDSIYALNVQVDGVRQRAGTDYTEDATGIEFNTAPATGAKVAITFAFDPTALSGGEQTLTQVVHQGVNAKPAAIRGKDIELWVRPRGSTTQSDWKKWTDVQSVNVDYRVSIEDDYEFGNPRAVSRDYSDAPEVTGSVEHKPLDPEALFDKLYEITGVASNEVIGPQSSTTLQLLVVLKNPDSGGTSSRDVGVPLKSLYVPDARFVLPGYEGRAQQKMLQTMNFESDSGVLKIYNGAPNDTQVVDEL